MSDINKGQSPNSDINKGQSPLCLYNFSIGEKMSTKTNKIKATIAAGAILAIGGVTTFSLLSDSSTTDIAVTSATFELDVNTSTDGTYVVDLNAENLAPGEYRSGDIVLTNNSSIPAIIDLDKNDLVNYEVTLLDDSSGEEFSTVTLPANGGKEELTLTVGLNAAETGSPDGETLTVTFNAEQEDYSIK